MPPDFFVFWKSGDVWPTYKDIIMFTLLGLPYWCTSQYMLQRSFAGRSVRHASRGLILAALMTGPLTLSYIIPGICGSLIYSGEGALAKPDLILPSLLNQLLPVGLGVLVGLSMYLPLAYLLPYGLGCLIQMFCQKRKCRVWTENWGVPLAAGLIVGEGLLGVVFAAIQVLGGGGGA